MKTLEDETKDLQSQEEQVLSSILIIFTCPLLSSSLPSATFSFPPLLCSPVLNLRYHCLSDCRHKLH